MPLRFYATSAGAEPVRDWLKGLPVQERQAIGRELSRVQWRWSAGMPLCRPLRRELWEVRTNLPGKRIARVLFCACDGVLVAVHGLIKKTPQLSKADLDLARRRMTEITK